MRTHITDTQRPLAAEAIRSLKARYFRDLDTKDWGRISVLQPPYTELSTAVS